MSFELSQTDARPMYQQIIGQIRNRILVGDWPPGYRLPSIRELAVATRVSLITVKRAYQELEKDGVIVTQQGKGSFVADRDDLAERMRHDELDSALADVVRAAKAAGLPADDVIARLRKRFKGA